MENVKKAFDLAQNEVEDKRVENLKNIIKKLLQKKSDLEEKETEIKGEIKLIKQDIDDFKAGRLDKVKERHDLDPRAKEVAPINITIIQDRIYQTYPLDPWRWNYGIGWGVPFAGGLGITTTSGGSQCLTISGTSAGNFTGGSYVLTSSVGSGIVNL